MSRREYPRRALIVLLIASAALVWAVMRPLAESILVASVMSAVLAPVHTPLTARLNGRTAFASVIVVLCMVTLVMAPIVGMSTFVVQQSAEAIVFVTLVLKGDQVDGLIQHLPDAIEAPLRTWIDVDGTLGAGSGAGTAALSAVSATVAATGTLAFQTIIMLLALYFFLTHRRDVLLWLEEASPLEVPQTRELLTEVGRMSVSVVTSTVLTAGVQSVAALIGFLLAGLPYALFFAGVTFFVGMIPAVGAGIVCIACSALLLAIGKPIGAAFLLTWSLLVVGLVDNLVKPLLIRQYVRINGVIVLFSLLGGLGAFGGIGLLVGPLSIALFLAVLRIYQREREDPPGVDAPAGPPATTGLGAASPTPRAA